MIKVFQSEFLKLKKSSIWLLIFVSPLLSTLVGIGEAFVGDSNEEEWLITLSIMSYIHALLFLPLLTGVFSAFVCRYEHVGGGWKQLLALPVSRGNIYSVKFLLVIMLLALTQLLFTVGVLSVGFIKGYNEAIPVGEILKSVMGGWIACMPLAALQMFVSVAWSSFAAPLAINVIFTLPNILVVNSAKYGPYSPWAQPFLAMMPRFDESFGALNVPPETLFIVIFGSFALFFLSGFTYFQRKEI
ncbi:ABC transporter permease [Bacillus sp. 31A1R]|uniref:ABC transporter permease n=1 Tax=Robertmurraya mangrovi TaxID=3098077 RepID=A0ABU5IX57_9BACI|nr:ABC transporter permease [Bacillus sp. 31A1R]MDZ5471743.1 ABC transporter permease [Bacillus sp. 31A1R]